MATMPIGWFTGEERRRVAIVATNAIRPVGNRVNATNPKHHPSACEREPLDFGRALFSNASAGLATCNRSANADCDPAQKDGEDRLHGFLPLLL
jgi:hypothetical protein